MEFQKLQKNIKECVDYVYVQAKGSSIKFKPSLTHDQLLCFLNKNAPTAQEMNEDDTDFINYLKNNWVEENFPNIYYRDNKIKKYQYIDHLIVSQTICLNITKNTAYFENKGTYVDVVPA